MKAVLTGIDFIERPNGDLNLLEINTNIALVEPYTQFFDFSALMSFCTSNSLTKINFIYTSKNAGNNFQTQLQSVCDSNNITLTLTPVPFNSITVPAIEDSEDLLILRHAYDVTAIIDDTYSRDKHEVTKLFASTSNENKIVPTYINSSVGSIDTLSNNPNDSKYPDFIVKKRYPDLDKNVYPKFFKTNSEDDISTLKSTYSGDYLLQNFIVDSNNITESGKLTQVRSFVMFYGGALDQLNLGSYRFSNLAPVSETLPILEDSFEISNNTKMEFTNNAIPNSIPGFPAGTMIQKLDTGTNNYVAIDISEIQIGDVLKTVNIPGIESDEPYGWETTGNSLPFATEYSSSPVSATYVTEVNDFLMIVHFNETESITMGINQTMIIYDAETNVSSFKFGRSLKIGDQAFVDINNALDDIVGIEYVYFSGNVYDVTLETDHVFLTYINGSNTASSYVSLLTHNKPKGGKA